MANDRLEKMFDEHAKVGGIWDFGKDHAHLLIHTWRALANGEPLEKSKLDGVVGDLGINLVDADTFLRTVTQRDDNDNVVSCLGHIITHKSFSSGALN